jgi:hypothetical protein
MSLRRLESEILALHNAVNLKNTLTQARAIGERLLRAKVLMKHGEWLPWLRRLAIRPRMAQLYMQAARNPAPEGTVGLNKFMSIVRRLNKEGLKARIADERAAAVASSAGPLPSYKVVCADCRRYNWPKTLDVVATDPPWRDIAAYRWLGKFAARQLKPEGLLLVQMGQYRFDEQFAALAAGGLKYFWTLAVVFSEMNEHFPGFIHPVMCQWRPVQIWSRGVFVRRRFGAFSDAYTIPCNPKQYHEWQQPLAPWKYWLERLTLPGELLADPYCGSGTLGLAVKQLGGARRYLGVDIDAENVKVARARLRQG